MEMFDIYNEDGSSAGYAASRNEAHLKGLWHKTVHVWIVNNKKQLLLQKRALNKEAFPGFWDISSAGHVDAGEASLTAAQRELKEELGVDASTDEFHYLFLIRQQIKLGKPFVIDNEFAEVFLLKRNLEIDTIHYDKSEVAGLKWISPSELTESVTGLPDIAQRTEEYAKLCEALRSMEF